MDLILASTSPYRRALLERLGIPFRALPPGVDERAPEFDGLGARELAGRLAVAKALAVAGREPDAVVIGGDQVVAMSGAVLGKPGTRERAIEQLAGLVGRSHELITAIAVVSGGHVVEHLDVTTMHVRPLSAEEIDRYVSADDPVDCAGSYKLECRGITLFESIESADHTAIVGIPLIALTTILRSLGFPIP